MEIGPKLAETIQAVVFWIIVGICVIMGLTMWYRMSQPCNRDDRYEEEDNVDEHH